MKIIYKTENGICILTPTTEVLELYTIDQIAKKDVPFGVEYWIVDDNEFPQDRTFRNAWEFNSDKPADGVGSESNSFEV